MVVVLEVTEAAVVSTVAVMVVAPAEIVPTFVVAAVARGLAL